MAAVTVVERMTSLYPCIIYYWRFEISCINTICMLSCARGSLLRYQSRENKL